MGKTLQLLGSACLFVADLLDDFGEPSFWRILSIFTLVGLVLKLLGVIGSVTNLCRAVFIWLVD